jgi:hypothetical protein
MYYRRYWTDFSSKWMTSIVAARSKAWNVFAHFNTGIVGSNPTEDMDVCVRLFYVPFKESYQLSKIKKRKWKKVFRGYLVLQLGTTGANIDWLVKFSSCKCFTIC